MYEKPKLVQVGKAGNVIRGLVTPGYDIDNVWTDATMEFRSDIDALPQAQ